jgi:hypothetical protein
MPRRRTRPDLDGLLEKQYGLVRRDQVLGDAPESLTKGALRWRLERGHWQTVLPAVYATHGGPLTREQRAFASLLYAGESAQLTGPAALHLHSLRFAPADDLVHVLIPDRRRLSPARFAAVSRTHRLDPQASSIGRMAVVSAARAVADTVRMVPGLDERAARALVVEALQRRMTGLSELQAELCDGPKRGSLLLRSVLSEVETGLRASPQARLRELCTSSAALPEIAWQPTLVGPDGERLPRPDGWIADTAIALEIVGAEFDPSPESWTQQLKRHNAFAEYGVLVLTFTANELRMEPATVLATIVRAYLERARAGVRHCVRMIIARSEMESSPSAR